MKFFKKAAVQQWLIEIGFGITIGFWGVIWYLAPDDERWLFTILIVCTFILNLIVYQIDHWYLPEHRWRSDIHVIKHVERK